MKSLWKSLSVLLMTCLLAVALPSLSGCEKKEKSPMDKLQEAGEKAKEAADDAAEEAGDMAEEAGEAVEDAAD